MIVTVVFDSHISVSDCNQCILPLSAKMNMSLRRYMNIHFRGAGIYNVNRNGIVRKLILYIWDRYLHNMKSIEQFITSVHCWIKYEAHTEIKRDVSGRFYVAEGVLYGIHKFPLDKSDNNWRMKKTAPQPLVTSGDVITERIICVDMSENFSQSKHNDDHNKLVGFFQDEWLNLFKGVIKNISIARRDKMLSLEFKVHERQTVMIFYCTYMQSYIRSGTHLSVI